MHTEPTHDEHHHHKPRHLAEKFEGYIGMIMVIAAAILAVGLIWGLMQSGTTDPSWMK